MYIVEGMKLRGNTFRWLYEEVDKNVAYFEFDINRIVSEYIVLGEEINGSYNQLDIYYKK